MIVVVCYGLEKSEIAPEKWMDSFNNVQIHMEDTHDT